MSDSQPTSNHNIGPFQLALVVFTLLVLLALVMDTTMTLPREVSNLVHMIDTFACAVFFAVIGQIKTGHRWALQNRPV